jgi:Holliday junction resolvasome RuvABC endonuclease subunit
MKTKASRPHSLGEAGGTMKLTLRDTVMGIVGYPSIPTPQQIKKFCSGSGVVPKDQVSKYVYKKWGVDAMDNNQADAYSAARIAMALALGITELQYEADVIAAMKKAASVHQEAPDTLRYEAAL